MLHPHGAYDVYHAVDVGPGVRLVGRGQVYGPGALGLELDRLAPELWLGVHRSVEDEVGRRVAGRPLRGVRVAAVRVKGRDGRVVANLKQRETMLSAQY